MGYLISIATCRRTSTRTQPTWPTRWLVRDPPSLGESERLCWSYGFSLDPFTSKSDGLPHPDLTSKVWSAFTGFLEHSPSQLQRSNLCLSLSRTILMSYHQKSLNARCHGENLWTNSSSSPTATSASLLPFPRSGFGGAIQIHIFQRLQ